MPRRLVTALACAVAFAVAPALPASAAGAGPALSVDASLDRHPISPDVYGMNWGDDALEAELGLTTDRWGGNATSRYNWTNNTTNLGSDWYFENYVKPADESLDATVKARKAHGTSTVVTVPMTGWVSKTSPVNHPWYCGFSIAKYGPQTGHDEWDTDCGTGVKAAGGNVTGNAPSDTSVAAGPAFVQSMVAHLAQTHGDAAHGGVRTYALDNEPALWNSTHRDVHPNPATYDEIRDRSVATAKAVKAGDPLASVSGPGDWGWCAYHYSPADPDGCGWGPDREAHGDADFAEWYLDQFKAASATAGKRLLDVFDEHYYPQAPGVTLAPAGSAETQALRLRSTRSLWDPTYTDESWIGSGGVGAPPLRFVPWLRETVAAHYPGTRVSIGEYNWGGLESVNGALAQADVLGIFGRERLDSAMLWDPPSPQQPGAFAFRMYRNYDGAGGRFGETSVRATSGDQSSLAAYAAQRSSDGAVTVMVVNKTGNDLASTVSLGGATYASAAQAWSYSGADTAHVARLADLPVSGNAVATTFAANSITLLVVPTVRAASALSAAVSPNAVTYGSPVTATGRLTSGVASVAGRPAVVEIRRRGTTTWTPVATVATSSTGTVAKAFAPQWSGTVRWRFAGDTTYLPATSPGVEVTVRAKVTSTLSPTTVARGGTARITGAVAPSHAGAKVSFQQWVSGTGWKQMGTPVLSPSSAYVVTLKPVTAGTRTYRIWWPGDHDHAAAAGPTLTFRVT